MEKQVKYMIAGSLSEIVEVIDAVRNEARFLSDKPNVLEFEWGATSEVKGEATITVESKIDSDEIAILTAEYSSLVIVESFGDEVQMLVSGGVQEQVV